MLNEDEDGEIGYWMRNKENEREKRKKKQN